MEVSNLERTFRAIMANNTATPALATLAQGSGAPLQIPEEFKAAIDSLSNRTHREGGGQGILKSIQAIWI